MKQNESKGVRMNLLHAQNSPQLWKVTEASTVSSGDASIEVLVFSPSSFKVGQLLLGRQRQARGQVSYQEEDSGS